MQLTPAVNPCFAAASERVPFCFSQGCSLHRTAHTDRFWQTPARGESIPASQFNRDERISSLLEEKKNGSLPSAHAVLQPNSGAGQGKMKQPRAKRRLEREEGAFRSEGQAVGQRVWGPGAALLPSHLAHAGITNEDALGTGTGQLFSQATGCSSLSNSSTCSSWSWLSSANGSRAGKEERTYRLRAGEQWGGKAGNAAQPGEGASVGCSEWQLWGGGRKEVTSSHTRELRASRG